MNRLYLLLVLAFSSLGLVVQAQDVLQIEPNIVRKELTIGSASSNQEEAMKVVVSNTSGRTLRLRWDKNVLYQPYVWESQVCDKEASYPPEVQSNYDPLQGVVAPIVLAPGESFDLFVSISSYNVKGQGKVEVVFREVDRPARVIGTAAFQLNLIDADERARLNRSAGRPTVYPNPVHDRFFLNNLPAGTERIDLYNTLGGKVRTFNRPQAGDSFEAGDLPQGVYLVSLVDGSGKVIRTLRLLRRDFRP